MTVENRLNGILFGLKYNFWKHLLFVEMSMSNTIRWNATVEKRQIPNLMLQWTLDISSENARWLHAAQSRISWHKCFSQTWTTESTEILVRQSNRKRTGICYRILFFQYIIWQFVVNVFMCMCHSWSYVYGVIRHIICIARRRGEDHESNGGWKKEASLRWVQNKK